MKDAYRLAFTHYGGADVQSAEGPSHPQSVSGPFRQIAREKYAWGSCDNIEIDDDAAVSRGDHGAFVQAWVRVEYPEEEGRRFINHYQCPRCGYEWDDEWDCTCDDDCGNCGCRHISPVSSEDAKTGEKVAC